MAKKNFYAVKVGRETGIFESWEECDKHTFKFKGAVYKGFVKREDAEAYLATQEAVQSKRYESTEEVMEDVREKEMVAFVDGSNLSCGSKFSWGVVTFSNELGKVDFNGKSDDERWISYRNVAGELFSSVKAIQFAIDNNMEKITIYHDYAGIRHSALGEWDTGNKLSQEYQAYFKKAEKVIDINFVKSEGHTDDKFNEEADVLAKSALGIKG